jgi:uncharacterized protein YjbI with pentapeptide repeats
MDHKPQPTENRDSQSDFLRPPIEAKKSRWGFRGLTVREWLELLIVPVVLALITVVFTWQQNERQQSLETKRTNHAQKIEDQRAAAEQALAKQRAQDDALQAYLDQMSHLLLEKDLIFAEEGSVVGTLARARTFAIMQRLDAERNQTIVRFLGEAKLIYLSFGKISLLHDANLRHADLSGAYLREADLEEADLRGADLSGANLFDAFMHKAKLDAADLRGANLHYARLQEASLHYAKLSDANLIKTQLDAVDLSGADLRKAVLRHARLGRLGQGDLSDANLSKANLRGVGLYEADLSDADLSKAVLRGAHLMDANLSKAVGLTDEQIAAAESLEGATMPNGQKYEDWIKDQEGRK